MPVTNRRTRTVIFRVTDQEYEILLSACEAKGARSLSDFARGELLGLSGIADLKPRRNSLAAIDKRISLLERRCADLALKINAPEPASSNESAPYDVDDEGEN